VILLDVVLAMRAIPTRPARSSRLRDALAARPELAVVAHVLGTEGDPQGLGARRRSWPRSGYAYARPTPRRPPGRRARRDGLMRVRLLTYSTRPRGGVVHALRLAEELSARGHEAELWALSPDGARFLREPRTVVHLVAGGRRPEESVERRVPRYAEALAEALRQADPTGPTSTTPRTA